MEISPADNQESLLSPTQPSNASDILQAEPSSKSRRRKKAKQASRARRGAAGDAESSGSLTEPPSDSSLLLTPPSTEVRAAILKKNKSRNKHKTITTSAQSRVDPMTDRLMSPTKKCQHEEKIAKAMENRGLILQEKTERVRQQTKKVDAARQHQVQKSLQKTDSMKDRQRRADEKRLQQITSIKIKARDEATKVDEINFINSLKSQNRIMDVIEKDQKVMSRQQIIEEERARRNEENRARDAAVEDRRRQQEQERVTKMTEMEEKKRLRVKKVEQNVNQRLQVVRGKARDRDRKLSAIEAVQQANMEALKERIQRKMEISTRLHEERMELKRLRAQYLRSPRPGSADSSANLQDMMRYSGRCRSHTGDNSPRRGDTEVNNKIRAQIEMDDISMHYERMGNKLRLRLLKTSVAVEVISRGSHLENSDVSHALDMLTGLKSASSWFVWTHHITSSLEPCLERLTRHVGFVMRSKDKTMTDELRTGIMQTVEFSMDAIMSTINGDDSSPVPEKPVCAVYGLLTALLACDTFLPLLRTDVFIGVLEQAKFFADTLIFREEGCRIVPENVFSACFQAVETILSHLHRNCVAGPSSGDDSDRMTDFLKYLMTVGLVQTTGQYHILALHHEDFKLRFLRRSFQFTTWISRLMSARSMSCDQTQESIHNRHHEIELAIYRDVLKSAPVFSSVTLLYDLLRLGRSQPRPIEAHQSELPEEAYRVAVDIICMLNHIGADDIASLQTVFQDLALSIQFRHICSFLIQHCLSCHQQMAHLLHEVVLLIGQFAFLSADHQDILHAGHPPTLLQQLARFPVEYLACPTLQDVLFPTLIICCFQNRKNCSVLAEELDLNHLTLYVKDRELRSSVQGALDQQFALSRKATPFYETLFRNHSSEDFFRYSFETRFPRAQWNSAAQFFYVCSVSDPGEEVLPEVIDSSQPNAGTENLDSFYREMCHMLSDGGGLS